MREAGERNILEKPVDGDRRPSAVGNGSIGERFSGGRRMLPPAKTFGLVVARVTGSITDRCGGSMQPAVRLFSRGQVDRVEFPAEVVKRYILSDVLCSAGW